ncbi:patatin-like phospholipase family protein [Streptomyces violaceus]|uniref:Patatin-like phospholipase family protein n=2 Tax=Streptomyces violaceus TaxID=1936 RepID=A0ABY9UGN4_STRVL|nr:patatin-like phospholipase family protein [Streptomyces janthinus]WND21462.1 patatin-like phospholipase family protein [Streptomyces janthinus]
MSTETSVALSLSGGGYRAMLFHAGALYRLCDTGWLERLDRVSSVSGGSIVAGQLATQWDALMARPSLPDSYRALVLDPLLALSRHTVDAPPIAKGIVAFGGIASKVATAYRNHLYGDTTLQEIPDHPRFVFNATNLQSGSLWRFSKPYARDYRVGGIENPNFDLGTVVAASSAFPPFLSPVILHVPRNLWTLPGADPAFERKSRISRIILSDGGIYDNLGLETVKRFSMLFVSDGGGAFECMLKPHTNWLGQLRRVLAVEDSQVRSLRKRAVIDRYKSGALSGAYWGIRTNVQDYGLLDTLPVLHSETLRLAAIRTRLASPGSVDTLKLVNWGYAICDAALRRYVDNSMLPPKEFPFPEALL